MLTYVNIYYGIILPQILQTFPKIKNNKGRFFILKRELLEQEKVVKILSGRGKNILIVGPTGVGKTHLTNSIFPSALKTYLNIREGEGLATLNTTTIILSDYIGLNENELIVTGKISYIDKFDRNIISECEKLLLDLIYEPVKAAEKIVVKTGDWASAYDEFKKLIETQIDNLKMYNDNTTLSYKLKCIENYDSILKVNILSGDIDINEMAKTLIDIYKRSKSLVNGDDIKRVFIDEIATKASLYVPSDGDKMQYSQNSGDNLVRKLLDVVVDSAVGIYNAASDEFLNTIFSSNDASIDEGRNFILIVNKLNYEKNAGLLKKIIGVSNDDKGYFVEEPTIYAKKDFKDILNDGSDELNDYYKTFVESGVEYHSMKIIDTQGLFHKNEEIDNECERIIDLLAKYQCNDIIYVISSKNDALTKKAKEVLQHLKNSCKKNINVNLAVTHLDEKILSKLSNISDGDFDDIDADGLNTESIVSDIINEQNEELYEELIKDNKPGKVLIDFNISYFSYPTHKANIDQKIKGLYDYNSNANRLLYKVAKNSRTYHIELKSDELPVLDINKMIDNIVGNDANSPTVYDVSSIYINMGINYYMLFGTPKKPALRIHHRTYSEALVCWKYYACKFKSMAQGVSTGYAAIETYFVEYIRSFIREVVVPKAVIDFSKVELKEQNDEIVDRFKTELLTFLKNEVSRAVTIRICDETLKGHTAVYDYRIDFMNILLECAKRFFPAQSTSLTDGDNLKNKNDAELKEYFNDDRSDGFSKVIILSILEIRKAIEQFIKIYCVVRF